MFDSIHLDHVVLRARDASALKEFYMKALECVVERELSDGLIQLRLGSILIDIISAKGELGTEGDPLPSDARNLDHFCLRVNPFDAEKIKKHFRICGVTHGPVQNLYGAEGFGPSIYFYDPEGNKVELKGPSS